MVRQQRIHLIDGMRGWSLLGILFANLLIFQYGMFGKDHLTLSAFDQGALHFTKIAIEGSFMPIFTFLFGYSMVKMAESIRRNGLKVKRFFARRSLLLIGLGLLHNMYIWEGDILLFYGLTGFFLLLFINRKTKTILVWGLLLFIFVTAMYLVGGTSDETKSERSPDVSEAYLAEESQVYATGTYHEIKDFRDNAEPFEELSDGYLLFLLLMAPLLTAPLFLFGMYAARINLFTNPIKEAKLYKRWMFLLLPLALLMRGFGTLKPENDWTSFLNGTGSTLLAIGYIFLFAYLYAKFSQSIVMQAFESMGKLSLTNYLLQSVICTTIFYGYGLGLFGRLGVFNGLLLGIGIFVLQCMMSYWYLKFFRRGPVEVIVRMWTNWSWRGRIKPKKTSSHVDNENLHPLSPQ